jgi:acetyl-CoA carboxylase biotin carboxyl carrier protein
MNNKTDNNNNSNSEIEQILDILRPSDVVELKISDEDDSILIRRQVTAAPARPPEKKPSPELSPRLLTIKSPLVGTFYFSASPDKPPYVLVGSHVTVGQKVGVIETMKIFKDVTSSVRGRIVKATVESGQRVEYGQELFLVEPEKENV